MKIKKRRIRNKTRKVKKIIQDKKESITQNTAKKNDSASKKVAILAIVTGLFILLVLIIFVINLIKSFNFESLVFSFGKDLKTDQNNRTNFLLIGHGGAQHDGANLTDTIIIANLNYQNNEVKMLSLPRDLYIEDKQTGGQRINKIYDTYLNRYDKQTAQEKLKNTINELTGIEIQYIIMVDFNGFVKIIDALGGIEVNVEEAIYDPYYPLDGTIRYQTFQLPAGRQTLDGETALKYARSRKTTSDFDRAKRQQQILAAAKEKALSMELLTDVGRIKNLYNSLSDSFESDLTVAEIIELGRVGKDINRNNIHTQVISDDFTNCGGFLYTPNRELFGGAAVLLPADEEIIHDFSDNYFYTDAIEEAAPIQILNATKTPGLAGTYLNMLSRHCLNTVYYGNATNRDQANSVIYYEPYITEEEEKIKPSALEVITSMIDAPTVEGIPSEYLETERRANSKIVIELGKDFKSIAKPDPFNNLLYLAPATNTTNETSDKTDSLSENNQNNEVENTLTPNITE
ncbi:hypothetical protein GF376_03045 [Candidatus Peregrinibacteria bacterium]|nr:hypothetical protein [Candidatus Peregrinibacteria bacterium]